MPIIRNGVGNYEKRKLKRNERRMERKADDFDLGFGDHRVYVLDEHEWFDPHTSTKYYDDGTSRHAMYGPAVIVQSSYGGSLRTDEHHVNDPQAWSWIRRCIAEGHYTAETQAPGVHDEREIKFS